MMILLLEVLFYRKRLKNARKNPQFPVRSHARLTVNGTDRWSLCVRKARAEQK